MKKFFCAALVGASALVALSACNQEQTTPTDGELDEGNATAIGISSAYVQNDATLYIIEFALINRTDLTCATLQANQADNSEYANFRAVGASITSSAPVAAGTYNVGSASDDGSSVQAFQEHSDSQCVTEVDDGTSGTITLTRVDATAITGTFDVVFQSGSHLKGAFNAPTCAVNLDPTTTSNGEPPPPPACK